MTNRTHAAILTLVLAAGPVGCNGAGPGSPTAPSTAQPPHIPQTTDIANVTLSVVVYEMTPMGRVPLEGVRVYASEWASGTTDANGLFTTTPVWVCPCSFAPWVTPGITQISVEARDPFQDSAVPPSVFYTGRDPVPAGQRWAVRDVMINGDTRIEVDLARR